MSSRFRDLRSRNWFFGPEYYNFARRTYLRAEGFNHDIFEGKPVIGICNSWSELNPCNGHLREVAEAVKRGVWKAGGVPLEFPVMSLGETFMRPTTMLYRNLMAMEVEESIRANPLDGVVLLSGCDKTTPAMLMGAISAGIPSILIPGGPMLSGRWRGRIIGNGTDGRKLFDQYRAGKLNDGDLCEIEGCVARSAGHCNVMGTASTMALISEALGMTLPGNAAIPAPDSRRRGEAELAGIRIVDMVAEELTPDRIMTPASLENAITACVALGGSTNAVVHLLAIAGRLGYPLTLDDFDRISRRVPWLTNIKPSGEFLMEEFFYAGGLPALLKQLEPLLHLDELTVTGRTLREHLEGAECYNPNVIRALDQPMHQETGLAILRGNLCPDGAVIKPTAASPELLKHRGRAYVFEDHEQMEREMDAESLPIDRSTILVMKNCGPKGAPGFPEWGWIPIPRMMLKQGVTDMVRISDARMSGTSFGTVVLHVAPESAVGGTLALVKTGDEIELDVSSRSLNLLIADEEMSRRRAQFLPPSPKYQTGYGRLFLEHVTQAHQGCDFDFLAGKRGPKV
jgi:L-arabonate dehydrase